jgi:hypothetical protein
MVPTRTIGRKAPAIVVFLKFLGVPTKMGKKSCRVIGKADLMQFTRIPGRKSSVLPLSEAQNPSFACREGKIPNRCQKIASKLM